MPKTSTIFVCSNCGNEETKWFGKCPACSQWNTCYEEKTTGKKGNNKSSEKRDVKPTLLKEVQKREISRTSTGFDELDRVLGGGLVKGSLTLLRWRARNW